MTLIELIASKMDEFPKAEKRVAQLFWSIWTMSNA